MGMRRKGRGEIQKDRLTKFNANVASQRTKAHTVTEFTKYPQFGASQMLHSALSRFYGYRYLFLTSRLVFGRFASGLSLETAICFGALILTACRWQDSVMRQKGQAALQ